MRLPVVLALLLGLGSAAYAEDWSSFIDHNPQKPIASEPAPVVKNAAKAKPKRVAKATARHKVKARAKKKTRHR
jgi:hypothetical protein